MWRNIHANKKTMLLYSISWKIAWETPDFAPSTILKPILISRGGITHSISNETPLVPPHLGERKKQFHHWFLCKLLVPTKPGHYTNFYIDYALPEHKFSYSTLSRVGILRYDQSFWKLDRPSLMVFLIHCEKERLLGGANLNISKFLFLPKIGKCQVKYHQLEWSTGCVQTWSLRMALRNNHLI